MAKMGKKSKSQAVENDSIPENSVENGIEASDSEIDEIVERDLEEAPVGPGEELEVSRRNLKEYAYSAEGLNRKRQEIVTGLPWEETLIVDIADTVTVETVDDDLNREAQFYDIALKGVKEGFKRLRDLNIPVARPSDYFAEMVKSDQHMKKVKAKLIQDKKELEEKEKRKTDRRLKKFGKKVQAEVQQQRAKEKKIMIKDVEKFRKTGVASDALQADFGLESKVGVEKRPSKNKKRERKDKKFGLGGKKRGLKRNSADSASDMSGFSKRAYKKVPAGISKNKKTKAKRPGKAARQKKR